MGGAQGTQDEPRQGQSYHITGEVARARVCLQKGLHGWMLPVISCTV